MKWTVPRYDETVLPYASTALTVRLLAAPAVVEGGKPVMVSPARAAAVTTVDWLALSLGCDTSVAVTMRLPAVLSTTPMNVWLPPSCRRERVVARQRCLGIRAGEVDRPAV